MRTTTNKWESNSMGIIELLLTAIALSMDAMAVSISSAIAYKNAKLRNVLMMALAFGVAQAAMPAAGYFIIPLFSAIFGSGVEAFVTGFDHWIAFVLLGFIGGKMVLEFFGKETEDKKAENPYTAGSIILMAIATSIDALATGIVFRGFSMKGVELAFAFSAIGVITFALSLVGSGLGKKVGAVMGEKLEKYSSLAGGVVLIGIGLKILIEHLI